MTSPSVVIVSPALADANNGNWQTARRWRQMLASRYRARVTSHWPDSLAAGEDGIMLALHARRSAQPVAAWHQMRGDRGLAVVLTGTDLYGDIASDAAAQASLRLAQRLVVLQELGLEALPAEHRGKARVIYQSSSARRPLAKTTAHLRAVMVGHLRQVKTPQTLFEAARLLRSESDILIDHVGEASDPGLGEQARATASACPAYRWLGGLPRAQVRQRIQRAHVLVHSSQLEGGAHVIMEAVRSGTPVLASRVAGNVGMLGPSYGGYFPHGDAGALADLLRRCRAGLGEQAPGPRLLERLSAQCALRAPLFSPETERAALFKLIHEMQDRR